MTPTPPKFVVKIPEKHITEKIEHSAKQCADMEFREILCPYCDTPLVTVTVSMREGILVAMQSSYATESCLFLRLKSL